MNTFEELVIKNGFSGTEEYAGMVAGIDISTAEKLERFKKWQYEDGTKAGLLKLGKTVMDLITDELEWVAEQREVSGAEYLRGYENAYKDVMISVPDIEHRVQSQTNWVLGKIVAYSGGSGAYNRGMVAGYIGYLGMVGIKISERD